MEAVFIALIAVIQLAADVQDNPNFPFLSSGNFYDVNHVTNSLNHECPINLSQRDVSFTCDCNLLCPMH